jgi:membrane dipeptidase
MENEYVRGLENPMEAWLNIPRWLVQQDYSDDEIETVLSSNVFRVFEEVW